MIGTCTNIRNNCNPFFKHAQVKTERKLETADILMESLIFILYLPLKIF